MNYSTLTREAALWGSLVGTLISIFLSGWFLFSSMNEDGASIFRVALAAVCLVVALRFYLRLILGARDPALVSLLEHLPRAARVYLFVIHLSLVLLSCISVNILRSFGIRPVLTLFLVQAALAVIAWFATAHWLFFADGVERTKLFIGRYVTTAAVDLVFFASFFWVLMLSDYETKEFEAAIGSGIAVYFFLIATEGLLHYQVIKSAINRTAGGL